MPVIALLLSPFLLALAIPLGIATGRGLGALNRGTDNEGGPTVWERLAILWEFSWLQIAGAVLAGLLFVAVVLGVLAGTAPKWLPYARRFTTHALAWVL